MLVINADDWGGWRTATDAAYACYQQGRITSVSAMVFMEDSERAAQLAAKLRMDVGLHLNFSQEFTGGASACSRLRNDHRSLARFLHSSRYALILYHPWLRKQFRYLFDAQLEEFMKLYGQPPTHFDGHQHMHLCTNMVLDRILPEGQNVRRSFTFSSGEKNRINLAYRRWVDRRLAARHRLTDSFYCLRDCLRHGRLGEVVRLCQVGNVELMTHPERQEEFSFLLSQQYSEVFQGTTKANYSTL